jgi:hypothetical protein
LTALAPPPPPPLPFRAKIPPCPTITVKIWPIADGMVPIIRAPDPPKTDEPEPPPPPKVVTRTIEAQGAIHCDCPKQENKVKLYDASETFGQGVLLGVGVGVNDDVDESDFVNDRDFVDDFVPVADDVPEGVNDGVQDFDGVCDGVPEGVDDGVPDFDGVAVVLLEQVMISEVVPLKEQAEGQLHGVHDDEPLYE